MAYSYEEVKLSQHIFYTLLRDRQIQEDKEKDLYYAYTGNEVIMNLVKSQGEVANSLVERYGNTIYLIPKEDNELLGFSKRELKKELCKSTGTDKDYYLSQFVILTLLVEFYDGQGQSSKGRDFIRVGEFQNIVADRLKEGASYYDEETQVNTGIAFSNMLEAFMALRSDEKGAKTKTTKEGFLHHILLFLERQGLIEYIEADEMVAPTRKLDQFMDFNLLNQNNYKRVLKLLSEVSNEQN
ncbi:hypothetical protein GMB70_04955 [Turicibacter sanguinis]|uniref:DUF6063 family protein n=1 Tax=Turicibacter sanguinis TaxID=154288 RepID=UPI0012BBCE0E|nr:DUF6063 family protein [Turicibacter sanguinis]MDB8436395.1 DUF6063 family protein [Turicibacter sanguinis]MDB8458263.1 DUF6063 family protein [Turicibacter sanguinis]MTO23698.1 hypothetical protein [Turicibacter sanguinis]MTO27076.1 hypothetical protein [Turicibacter sanguinis]MTO89925.1 hypothetical protein [Turicibacter sanguinis]